MTAPAEKKLIHIKKAKALLHKNLKSCQLCPRNCNVDRSEGKKGYCAAGKDAVCYTAFLHRGEEPPLCTQEGSGTVFFSGCSLRCLYCQNFRFSHSQEGRRLTPKELARLFLGLQKKGASNINLVTATHFLIPVIEALSFAYKKGLTVPIVYNSSGYENLNTLQALDGIVDVYLADCKYVKSETAAFYSDAADYPIINQAALKEMARQATPSAMQSQGTLKGLIVRHLVLPTHIEESKQALLWIKENLPGASVSVMAQYRPYDMAQSITRLKRPLTAQEYASVKGFLEDLEMEGWIQDYQPDEAFAGVHFPSTELNSLINSKE